MIDLSKIQEELSVAVAHRIDNLIYDEAFGEKDEMKTLFEETKEIYKKERKNKGGRN
jgi:hypothetical protein